MIDLPTSPGPAELAWKPIDFGGRLTPPTGGRVQRVNRLGNRFALGVTMPVMTPETARPWIAALNRGVREGVRFVIRQVEFNVSAPGTPVVDGGDNAGSALAIRGATPHYAARVGQFLSIEHDGAGYLHLIGVTTVMDAAGAGTLSIDPWLRIEPADGDAVELGRPKIEGLLEDGSNGWTIPRARRIGLSFTIVEVA